MSLDRNKRSRPWENQSLRIYLAGPEVFLRNATEIGERKKDLCVKYGFEGVFPIDVQLDVTNKSRREGGLNISAKNESLIQKCQLLIANITPFRGPSADVGTAFEMGFARGIGLRVCAYTNTSTLFTERTKSNNFVSRGVDGVLRDENGMAIEEWELVDNLMLDGSINASRGILVIENAPKEELFTYLGGFEKCLQYARKVMLVDLVGEGLK